MPVRPGFRSIEHVKRYTTTGMGTDQGKTSNVNALAIVAEALGQGIAATGYTTFRAPYTPVTFGALAGPGPGELFDPVRKTPQGGRGRSGRRVRAGTPDGRDAQPVPGLHAIRGGGAPLVDAHLSFAEEPVDPRARDALQARHQIVVQSLAGGVVFHLPIFDAGGHVLSVI